MIDAIKFTPAPANDVARGLLAYVRLRYGSMILDGVTLRRTRDGRLTISWPSRRDRSGAQHALVRPATDSARKELEDAVFAELRRQEGAR